MRFTLAIAAIATLAMPPAYADVTAPAVQAAPQPVASLPPAPSVVLEAPANQNILRSGTEVQLIMREELTTEKKKVRIGQRFQLEVAANVEANGVIVIPVGTPAVGEVTEVRNKGMWGKSGYINARVVSMRYGDRTIRLSGTFDDKGVTGTGAVVGAVVFVPVVGFFTTGTSARIPSGAAVKAFLDEDIVFRPVAAQPQVIAVPAASQPVAPVPATTPVSQTK